MAVNQQNGFNIPDLVSVILVNWNTRALTEVAIRTFRDHERSTKLEFIIVDNASTDGSADYLEQSFPDAVVVRSPENEGFARGNNRGVEMARGRYVLLLNTDTVAHEEVLPACIEALQGPSSHGEAIVACRLLNADGSLQVSAEAFPTLASLVRETLGTTAGAHDRKLKAFASFGGRETPKDIPIPVDWLSGAFLFMKRDTYRTLGGFSPSIFMYGEDVELCWRAAQRNIRCLYLRTGAITHLGGGATDHTSLRGLLLSDAGRLRSFALMRGPAQAFLYRMILMTRSLIRGVVWTTLGLMTNGEARERAGAKARIHWIALVTLARRGAHIV
jgi:GT2 family glycosyltransferase